MLRNLHKTNNPYETMKKSKKLLSVTLVAFILAVCLSASSFGYSLVLENDYADIIGVKGSVIGQTLSLNIKKGWDPRLITINYSPEHTPLKSYVIISLKKLLHHHHKKSGNKTSSINVHGKKLEVSYYYDVVYEKSQHEDRKKSKFKHKLKKIKNIIWGKKIESIYLKIKSAKLDGAELGKVQK